MTLDKNELVTLRDYVVGDRNFILATFLRGLFYGGFFWSEIPKGIFMSNYHTVAEALVASPNTKIRVACLKEDPEVILSYVMTNKEETVIHWMFTKSPWRGIGLAKSLVPLNVESVSHLSKQGLSLIRRYPAIVFNPFTLK